MFTAFNTKIIVKVTNDTNLKNQTLEAEVLRTTDLTKELQGKTIVAERRYFTDLGDTGESSTTTSGIILGDRISYAALDAEHVVAIKDGE